MSADQLSSLQRAIAAAQAISDDRGYQHWAGIHGLPLPMYCQHGTPLFLPWHRAYLYFFELDLRDQVADVVLPWWDWSVDQEIPAAYNARKVGNNPNPLFNSPIQPSGRDGGPARTNRKPGAPDAPPLPTPAQVQAVVALDDFIDFQTQLEDIHNGVHVWVGGTMGEIPTAAYDPLFYAHHVDDRPRLATVAAGTSAGRTTGRAARPGTTAISDDGGANARLLCARLRLRELDGNRSGDERLMVSRFVSAPIALSPDAGSGDYSRADLIFHGVDHSLASYEGRVYINAPKANAGTGREHPSYAGSFHIFGHGGCFGDLGHCEIPTGPRDPFDVRQAHPLTPAAKVVIVTAALKRIVADKGGDSITVTVVCVAPGRESNEYLKFDEVHLVTYR